MADNRFLSDRNPGEYAGLDFTQLDLRNSGQLTRIAAGVALVVLGASGRSNLLRLAFTLGGATLLFRAFSGGMPRPGRRILESRPLRRVSRSVMRSDETIASQRTRGGGVGDQEGVKLIRSITINRPVEEVYQFWKEIENLPHFMDHVETIHKLDDRHSHWIVNTPAGSSTAEWYMEIINDHPNELIAWQSMPGSDLPNAGSVRFAAAPDGGTIVRVKMEYQQPHLGLGVAAAEILGDEPDRQLLEDLGRLKFILESPEERNRFAKTETTAG